MFLAKLLVRSTLVAALTAAAILIPSAAVAQTSPSTAGASTSTTAAPLTPELKKVSIFRRPVFLGLVAAVFLMFGAACGANDRPDGDQAGPGPTPPS